MRCVKDTLLGKTAKQSKLILAIKLETVENDKSLYIRLSYIILLPSIDPFLMIWQLAGSAISVNVNKTIWVQHNTLS